jgi:hypothetical protein
MNLPKLAVRITAEHIDQADLIVCLVGERNAGVGVVTEVKIKALMELGVTMTREKAIEWIQDNHESLTRAIEEAVTHHRAELEDKGIKIL